MPSTRRHNGTSESRRARRKIQPCPSVTATASTIQVQADVLPLSPPLSVKSAAPSPPLSLQHSKISGRRLQKPLRIRHEVAIAPKPSTSGSKHTAGSPSQGSRRTRARRPDYLSSKHIKTHRSAYIDKAKTGGRMGYDEHVVIARKLPLPLQHMLGNSIRADLCLGDIQAALSLQYMTRDSQLVASGALAEETETAAKEEGKAKRKNGVLRTLQKGHCENCGMDEVSSHQTSSQYGC